MTNRFIAFKYFAWLKYTKKSFGGLAPPGPTGEAYSASSASLRAEIIIIIIIIIIEVFVVRLLHHERRCIT